MRAFLVMFLACTACSGAPVVTHEPATSVARTTPSAPAPTPAAELPAPDTAADPPTPEDLAAIAARSNEPVISSEHAPRFAPDGRQLAFVVTEAATRTLVLQDAAHPTEPPRRVAALDRRINRPVFAPDGRSLYFLSDNSGDEAYGVYRIDLASGELQTIDAASGVRHQGPWLSRAGDRMLFNARPMQASGTILHEQHLGNDAAAPSIVFESTTLDVVAVSPDASTVALVRAPRADALFLLDLLSGSEAGRPSGRDAGTPPPEPRRIHPLVDGPSKIHDAAFSPDGSLLYVAADDGGELTRVLAFATNTGREVRSRSDESTPGGVVQGLIARGSTVAYVIDLGTHHALRLLDARSLSPRPAVNLPLGSEVPGAHHPNNTGGLSLSGDGRLAAIEWSTPDAPSRVLLVDARTGSVSNLTPPASGTSTHIDARVERVRSFDGLEIPTLLYGSNRSSRGPVVMYIHGGFPFASTAAYNPWLARLVAEGYVVVAPNVRGSSGFGAAYERADDGAKKLDGVRDFRAVGEWIASQPWADPRRIAVMGPSAGGYYTLMTIAHQPDLWRAAVAIVPLYDLRLALAAMDGDLRLFLSHELAPDDEPALLAALSPSTYVDSIRTPLFVYAGARDVRTPAEQILSLVGSLRQRGRRVEFMLAQESGHSRSSPATVAEMDTRVLRFLRTELAP